MAFVRNFMLTSAVYFATLRVANIVFRGWLKNAYECGSLVWNDNGERRTEVLPQCHFYHKSHIDRLVVKHGPTR